MSIEAQIPALNSIFEPTIEELPPPLKDSHENQCSIAVIFKTRIDHNKAFDWNLPHCKLYMDTLKTGNGSLTDLEIRTPDGNIHQELARLQVKRRQSEFSSLTIWAHGEPNQTYLGRSKNAGSYKIEDVAAEHFSSLKFGAPIYLASCSTAPLGKKIAEVSHHPVYAPSNLSYTHRTFLIPNENGELELLQWGTDGERITRLFRYENNILVEQEPKAYKKAFSYLLKKAKEGNTAAQFAIGEFYQYGKEINLNWSGAAHWFAAAAKQGDISSLVRLEYLADQGCAAAALNLGKMYREGTGVNKSEEEAMKWFAKAKQASCCNLL